MDGCKMTAVQLAKAIRAGETTAVEAMQEVLEQIEQYENTYHCYVTVDKEGALQRAAQVQAKIEAGELTGPLAGVPVANQGQHVYGRHAYHLFLQNFE